MSDPSANSLDPLKRSKSEHRALAVLRMLQREPLYASNEEIIASYFEMVGLACSREQVRECLSAIERINLIVVSVVERLTVVRLTGKGSEVARGLIVSEGVLRPSVDCPY